MQIFMPVNEARSARPLKLSGKAAEPLRRNGFTLVEMMVVVAIIGVAVTALVLTLSSRAQAINQDAERLATRLSAARDQAVVGGQPVAVWVGAEGYGFEYRLEGEWRPMTERNLENINWRTDISAEVPADERLRIAFDNTGLPNQALQVVLKSGEAMAQVTVNELGEVDIVR